MDPPYFTVSACHRCRKRKTRCDARLPACLPCQKVGSRCEYNDVQTKVLCSRDYIRSLEAELDSLERELRHITVAGHAISTDQVYEPHASLDEGDLPNRSPSSTQTSRAQPALDSLDPGNNSRYLGASSGMHLARSVLNSARLNDPFIDHVPPGLHHARTEPVAIQEAAPSASPARGPDLPSDEVAFNLIQIFLDQYQLQYPIVSQEWLLRETHEFYRQQSSLNAPSPKDTCTGFILQMIFAISLLAISNGEQDDDALTLAEGFYASAMSTLTTVMEKKGLDTLQCLLLLVLYSLLHFSATPIWHISGLSMRMAIDLGLHSEATIKVSRDGEPTNLEVDCKRRVFWATYTLDRTLSIMLGRPFTLEDRYIDVAYPELSLPEEKRQGTIHWIKLLRLQSIAVSSYHLSDNQDGAASTTIEDVTHELAIWNEEALSLAETSWYTSDWWQYWYHSTLLMLNRPSPNSAFIAPNSSSTCYTAAKNVIETSFVCIHTGRLDVTCVDIHYQFMAGITLLYLVWNSTEIRKQAIAEWTSFRSCLVQWELVLEKMATRWGRASRAKDVVRKLLDATVDAVEREMAQSLNKQMTHKNGQISRARERERVMFIMGQLASPRTNSLVTGQRGTPADAGALPGPSGSHEAPAVLAESTRLAHAFSGDDSYEDGTQQPEQQTFLHSNQLPTSFANDAIMTDASLQAQEQSWQEAEFAQISQMLRGAFDPPGLPFPPDISAMLGDSLWSSSLDASDNAYLQTNPDTSGLFANFGSASGSIVDDTWFDKAGRARNMAWADSVLNFPDEWEDN
ncbi:fungal-specific transcription factor domain-containing protein [Aspergillus keveii]|uniref:Fungal-specific transcription factor domain-containing protein n=1 Tax=Aspergillus keveii TaxID=714993 RepID=A0ABR4FY75_9EURO